MKKNKKWSDLTLFQKMLSLAAIKIQLGLLAVALLDLQRRPNDEIRGNKWIWRAVVFINFIGPISYFLFGRKPESELLAPLPQEVE